MPFALPLLISAAMTTTTFAVSPLATAEAIPDHITISALAKQQQPDKRAKQHKTTKPHRQHKKTNKTKQHKQHKKTKQHKKHPRLGHLRVIISGSPEGRVHVKGPKTHLDLTKSSLLKVRSGRYHLHAATVRLNGDKYLPAHREWTFTVRKGATSKVAVAYRQTGSSAPGAVDRSTPPAGMLNEVFSLVNQARSQARQCGDESMPAVDPVVYDHQLARAAQGHAEDMNANDYFEHDSLDGRTFSDRIEAAKYAGLPAGENIAMGFDNASDVVTGWLNSPGHCVNIMDPDFDEMGLGFATHVDARYSVPVTYWVQDFGYAAR